MWEVSHSWLGNLYCSGNLRLGEQNYEVCSACKEEEEGGGRETPVHAPLGDTPAVIKVTTFHVPVPSTHFLHCHPEYHSYMSKCVVCRQVPFINWSLLVLIRHIHKHSRQVSWVLVYTGISQLSKFLQPTTTPVHNILYASSALYSCWLKIGIENVHKLCTFRSNYELYVLCT